MDRTRASDTERERVVAILREAATQGRIAFEELDERSAAAYAAATRGELAALIDDLPQLPAAPPRPQPSRSSRPTYRAVAPPPSVRPWPELRPRLGGMQMFSARWRTPADPREAGRQVWDHVVPLFIDAAYDVVHRTSDELMLQNERGDTVLIEMTSHPEHTETHIWGVAPQAVRRGLRDLSR